MIYEPKFPDAFKQETLPEPQPDKLNIIPAPSGSIIEKGSFASPNYRKGTSGWVLNADGSVEFGDGTFRGTLTLPSFSVDVDGNVVANSLRRADFAWFTMFESIDGYQNASTGTGALSVDRNGVTLATGATSGSDSHIVKGYSGGSNTSFVWSKLRSFKSQFSVSAVTSQNVYIATGSVNNSTDEHFGFYVSNATLWGSCADGTTESTTNLNITVSAAQRYSIEAIFTPGVSVQYYVDGVLKGTSIVNLPSSTNFPFVLFDAKVNNTAAADKQMTINYFDFWQAN